MVPSLLTPLPSSFYLLLRSDMVLIPKLEQYDLNALVALGNLSNDEFSRNRIKVEIVNKLLDFHYPMFSLLVRFKKSILILKESYADVILINMKDNDYYIDDGIVDEILKLASFDALICYGADSASYEFNIKCKDEFYRRGYDIEDKIEFQMKVTLGKSLKKKINIKRKVIRNDKY